MVQFGRNPSAGEPEGPVSRPWKSKLVNRPSPGTLFKASQFLSEELPIRLAHRVKELNQLPDGLNEMPSIQKVANWYMQSFEVGDSQPAFPPLFRPMYINPRGNRRLLPCRSLSFPARYEKS